MELFSGQSDNVTARQSDSAVCLGCLTHCACVGHWTPDYSTIIDNNTVQYIIYGMTQWRLPVADVKEDGQSAVICPCHLHDLQPVLDQPVCSMLVYYSQA